MDPFYTDQPRFQTPFPSLWRCYTLWVQPKIPLKFHQNECWMTCSLCGSHSLPHPSSTFYSWLGPVGCRIFTPGSLGCCFDREKTGTSFSQILSPIKLLSLCQRFKAWDHLQPKTFKGLTQNSPYIDPDPTTKDPNACTPFHPTSFTEHNSSQIDLSTQPLQRRPTNNVSSKDKSPEAQQG